MAIEMHREDRRRMQLTRENSVLCVSLLIAAFCFAGCHAVKPNFIIFQPDDYPFYWDEAPENPPGTGARESIRNQTPHLDKIRAEGVVFARAYAASAMCAPSRFSVLTGRYSSRSKTAQQKTAACDASFTLTDVAVPKCKLDDAFDQTSNLQSSLRDAGYTTGVVGKWHVSVEGSDPWDISKYDTQVQKAKDTGMDYADGFYIANMDNSDTLTFSHNQEWITEKGVEFIEEAVNVEKPFFLYFNPTLPHAPSPVDALNVSIRETPSGTLSADPVSGMPDRANVISRANTLSDRAVAAIQVDDAAGTLYAKLEELGILDNTMFVFIMDHGIVGKSSLYESGARIAMFARCPDCGEMWQAGKTYHNIVSNIDLAPTILHLATGQAPLDSAPLDGTSLLTGQLHSSQAEAEERDSRAVFVELGKDRAVVTQRLKFIAEGLEGWAGQGKSCELEVSGAASNAKAKYPSSGESEQVFDLSTDPVEQTNVRSSIAAGVWQGLKSLLDCHLASTAINVAPSYKACGQPEAATQPTTETASRDELTASRDELTTTPGKENSNDVDMTASSGSTPSPSPPDIATTPPPSPEVAVRLVLALPYSTGEFEEGGQVRSAFRRAVAAAAKASLADVEITSVTPSSSSTPSNRRAAQRASASEGDGQLEARLWHPTTGLVAVAATATGRVPPGGASASAVAPFIAAVPPFMGAAASPLRRRLAAAEGVDVGVRVRVASELAGAALVASGQLAKETLDAALQAEGLSPITSVVSAPTVQVADSGEEDDDDDQDTKEEDSDALGTSASACRGQRLLLAQVVVAVVTLVASASVSCCPGGSSSS